jgi:hypothetical protein
MSDDEIQDAELSVISLYPPPVLSQLFEKFIQTYTAVAVNPKSPLVNV